MIRRFCRPDGGPDSGQTRRRLLTLILLAGLAPWSASAHELQTVALQLQEQPDGTISASLVTPLTRSGEPGAVIATVEGHCQSQEPLRVTRESRRIIRNWQLHCPGGLDGERVRFTGLDPRTPEALITLQRRDGHRLTWAVDRHDPVLRIELAAAPAVITLGGYFPLGVEHILRGMDHLLFVFGLMLVVAAGGGGTRALILALTAFTAAHSLTLGLAMLGLWGLPAKPVEILIALSIVLLACELVLAERRQQQALPPTLTLRKPWLAAFVFGLLHGFGFAGALSDIGLPAQARGWALLLFNLGVEAGQLIFVAMALPGLALLRQQVTTAWQARTARACVILLGGVAIYWTLDRGALWIDAMRLTAGRL